MTFGVARGFARLAVRRRAVVQFILLGRPQFLVGGFVLYGLGAALAVALGAPFRGARFLLGQLVVTAAQLATHYANDYFDLEADRANRTPTRWSGGSRVLPDGLLPPRVARDAAGVLYGTALGGAVSLIVSAPRLSLLPLLAGVMIGLAWAYSAPPARLAARGLGEAATAIVVTLCVPLLGHYLQAEVLDARLFAAVAPPFALQFAMLLAIELPDAAGDKHAGKRTLVVRLGAPAAARLYAAATIAAFGALPLGAVVGLPGQVVIAPMGLMPLALLQALRVARGAYGDPECWESIAFWSVALLIGTAAIELVATLMIPGG